MPRIVRLGDTSDHGGSMITATAKFRVNGIRVCINGDKHSCPIPGHGVTSVTGTGMPVSNNESIVKTSDVAGCGAVIINGSPDTYTN